MNAIGGTCLVCQAELRSNTRFCPACGRPTGNVTPGAAFGRAVSDDTRLDDTLPGSPVPGRPWPGNSSPGQEPGDGPGFTVVTPPSQLPPAPAPPAPVSPPVGWGPTVTQPALPARPHPAPLPPAPWPQALPSPPQPQPAPSYPPPYPPPAYQRPDYEQQRPPHPQGFDPFRLRDPAVPSGTGPAEMGPPSMGPPSGLPRQPPRRHDGRRPGSSVALWTVLLVFLVGGGTAGFLIARPFSHSTLSETASAGAKPATPGGSAASAGPGGASSVSPSASGGGITSPSAPSSAPAVTEQQAATSVAAMLSHSVSDRASISSAASDVGACGPNLNSDPKVFDDAASSRKALLASLTTMPGRATLPPAVISDLTQAWQASIAADQAYAQWANDEITQGCVQNDTSDPGYQAAVTPNTSATKYKTAFVAGWNPVAAQYGLTQYQQGQL